MTTSQRYACEAGRTRSAVLLATPVYQGVEYGAMQRIRQAYDPMRDLPGMTRAEMGDTFERWSQGGRDS